jgi:hypothetical protein
MEDKSKLCTYCPKLAVYMFQFAEKATPSPLIHMVNVCDACTPFRNIKNDIICSHCEKKVDKPNYIYYKIGDSPICAAICCSKKCRSLCKDFVSSETNGPIGGYMCKNCSKINRHMFQCSGCKMVRYCNRECQEKDWSEHKKSCKRVDQKHEKY